MCQYKTKSCQWSRKVKKETFYLSPNTIKHIQKDKCYLWKIIIILELLLVIIISTINSSQSTVQQFTSRLSWILIDESCDNKNLYVPTCHVIMIIFLIWVCTPRFMFISNNIICAKFNTNYANLPLLIDEYWIRHLRVVS